MGLLNQKYSEVILGAAVLDDILSLFVLAFIINVPGGEITAQSLGPLVLVLLTSAIYIIGGVFAGSYFLRKIVDTGKFNNMTFLCVIFFLFIYSYVAEVVGLSIVVGAFLAGMVINQSKHLKEIEERYYPLELLFTPIFFISIGLLIDVNILAAFAIPITILTIIAIVTKIVGCGLAALLEKMGSKESLIVGIGMAPRGEVALVIALLGLSRGIFSTTDYSIISIMVLLTALVTPLMLKKAIEE